MTTGDGVQLGLVLGGVYSIIRAVERLIDSRAKRNDPPAVTLEQAETLAARHNETIREGFKETTEHLHEVVLALKDVAMEQKLAATMLTQIVRKIDGSL